MFVANPDEEIGSPARARSSASSPPSADACFVLECARANGDIVSARKGIVDLRITVHGRAAHAGVEPEKGRSAILEAAHQTIALHALNGRWPGVTVQRRRDPGRHPAERRRRARRSSRSTCGPPRRADLEAAEAAVRAIAAATDRARTSRSTVEEMSRHWPMERLERSGRLVDHAQALADRLGLRAARRGDRRRLRREHDRRASACRRSTASARSAATTTRRPSTSRSTRSCRGRRCSRRSCSPSARDPRSSAGVTSAGDRRRGRAGRRDHLVGRSVGGVASATAGRSSSATAAGSPARPTPGPTAARAIRATRAARRVAVARRSSSGPWTRRGSPSPTSSGRGCSSRHGRRWPRSSAVHGEFFGDVRPAATIVEVPALIDPSLLVEIEVDARRADRAWRRPSRGQPGGPRRARPRRPRRGPRNRFRRQAIERDRRRRPPATRPRRGRPAGRRSVTTITLTAASAASTAGPTSRR